MCSSESEDEPYFKPPGYVKGSKKGVDTEREWREKLAAEFDDELYEHWGAYQNQEEYGERRTRETYDDWSDRIYTEYVTKNKRERTTQHFPTSKRGERHHRRTKETSQADKLRKEREKMKRRYEEFHKRDCDSRLKRRKASYNEKYKLLLDKGTKSKDRSRITMADLPWNEGESVPAAVDTMLDGINNLSNKMICHCLKNHIRTWHPDKFQQKFGENLCDKDRERILERVNSVSQELNSRYEKLREVK